MTQQVGAAHEVTAERFRGVRGMTEELAAPLSAEDQTVQSMPDASPSKWHRAHTTWFFEEFVLGTEPGYEVVDPSYRYLFNSYYEAVGPRHARAARGVITRPGIGEVADYRRRVDDAVVRLLERDPSPAVLDLVELGLHHEQQHQELLLMDIEHALSQNPTDPVYRPRRPRSTPARPAPPGDGTDPAPVGWVGHEGGRVRIGSSEPGFAFDNERPAHHQWVEPFEIADRPVTNAEIVAFIADGGYHRSDLWLSDGWAAVQQGALEAPLHWQHDPDRGWTRFTLAGREPVEPDEPAVHLSYYEADAVARWAGARLPTEAEWETAARCSADAAGFPGQSPVDGNFLDTDVLRPLPAPSGSGARQLFGDVWEWTASAYLPYPGFRPSPGAVGEYNGKFMVGQHVLRGGSFATPVGHVRPTYRNFFPPGARWAFSGVRLARGPVG